jgi:hypothetical protein
MFMGKPPWKTKKSKSQTHWFKNETAQKRAAEQLRKDGHRIQQGQMAGGWKGRYPMKYYIVDVGKK